ncbi:MAG: hypothetical protein ABSH01_05080 [Terriglobia bacterium]
MSRFSRNDPRITWSPDKRYIAFVTTRGIVETDEVESTLWILRHDEIRQVLAGTAVTTDIASRIGARLKGSPEAKATDSYEPLITDERWTSDSKGLLFLGQASSGNRRLFRVNVHSRAVTGLTGANYDVSQFELRGGTIVYRATRSREFVPAGPVISRAATDITDVPLDEILPLLVKGQHYIEQSELWAIQSGRNNPIIDPKTMRPVPLWNYPPPSVPDLNPLSISPDGRRVVVLTPCRNIPRSWETYEPIFASGKIRPTDEASSQLRGPGRPIQFAIVDLEENTTELPINAPNAWALGYTDRNMAIWFSGGGKLLLTDTYLSLNEKGITEGEREARHRPCAAAVLDLTSRISKCVAYSKGRALPLLAAGFGRADDEVFLRFGDVEEWFRFQDEIWRPVSDDRKEKQQDSPHEGLRNLGPSEDLSLDIRQDLNTPPKLWATDRQTKQSKMIWDPNPGLAQVDLGQASVLRWKDSTGYEWTGGLVTPPNYVAGRRYPLVIQTHGFLEHEFMTDGAYTTAFAARALAAHGIVVLQIEDRYDHLLTTDEASIRVLGFESAIYRLASEGLIDPKRVGIIGFSRTCYYVETALINDPERFAAATLADGVDVSYMQYLLFAESSSARESEQIYGKGPFGEGLREWMQRSPGFHLDQIQTPLRIEAIGPFSLLAEREIYASLWMQGKAVDLIYFPNGQHILQRPLERLASQQGNVDWFCFWLLDNKEADPAKKKQYAAWRQLRAQHRAPFGAP